MTSLPKTLIAGIFTACLSATGVLAGGCPAEGDPADYSDEQVDALYDCMHAKMAKAYTKGDNPVAAVYRDWTKTSTRPAAPGPHSERFLFTFANDIAAEQYLKYAEEEVVMPEGSVLAKESFRVKKGKAIVGPLFIMTKVAEGTVPDTNDWVYAGVMPNGKPLKFKQSFCHDCHWAYEDQDGMAYPDEDVRLPVAE